MIKKKYFPALLSIILLLAGTGLYAQQVPKVTATLDTNAIMIGDQIGLNIKVSVPKGYQVYWPVLSDTLAPHIELIRAEKTDSIIKNDQDSYQRKLVITSFDSGAFTVPSFVFHLRNNTTGQVDSLSSQEMELKVFTPMVDTAKAFKVINAPESVPYTFAEILPWILIVLGIALGIYTIVWYVSKRKKGKPLFAKKTKPKLPPYDQAIKRLEELRLNKVWQSGKIKEYYTGITDIMREYFTDRYQFEAWEMTSDEILYELKGKKVNAQAMEKVKATLELSDLVKFAKAQPTALENDTALNYCVDFVNETKPEIIVPQQDVTQQPMKQNDKVEPEKKKED
ncbi:MAG: hypothetical protein JXR65_01650 [Bacteroidales bacterium]|nr:hypothetical protein [Bacteroidales bacterium]